MKTLLEPIREFRQHPGCSEQPGCFSRYWDRLFGFLLLIATFSCAHADDPATLFMYRQTPQHTGRAGPGESLSTHPRLLWKYETVNVGIHSASKSSPVADATRIYVGADNERFYALDKRTGKLQWQWACRPCRHGIHASPAVDAKCVYIGDYGGWLTALEKTTGQLVWETRLGDSIGASPVIVGDRIYTAVETGQPDGYLAAVDRATGESLYSSVIRFGNHSHCTPTVDPDSSTLFLGSNQGYFHCFDTALGGEIWRFATRGVMPVAHAQNATSRGQIKSTAALAGPVVLFTSWDHRLYCLDQRTGKPCWRFKTGDRAMSSPAVDIESNRVYVGSHDRHVYAVDLKFGEERWRFATAGRILSSPVIVPRKEGRGKMVVIGSSDATLYMLDDETGSPVWKTTSGSAITGVPCISDGRLYVSTNGGQLLCWE